MIDLTKTFEYTIQVGVIDGNAKTVNKNGPLTNAELMYIHEYGAPTKNIPARPVLQMSVDYANNQLIDTAVDKAIDAYLKGGQNDLEKELLKTCQRIKSYAQEIIYSNDGRLQSNAPSTIKQKGFNHPLFISGALARSIDCILINDKGDVV